MEASPFIGSSIFLYIMAFIVVMVIGGYLTYRISPRRKQRREEEERKNRR